MNISKFLQTTWTWLMAQVVWVYSEKKAQYFFSIPHLPKKSYMPSLSNDYVLLYDVNKFILRKLKNRSKFIVSCYVFICKVVWALVIHLAMCFVSSEYGDARAKVKAYSYCIWSKAPTSWKCDTWKVTREKWIFEKSEVSNNCYFLYSCCSSDCN